MTTKTVFLLATLIGSSAWAAPASAQDKYPIDPHTFKVVDGKLYLFYNQDGFNALEHWNRDEATTRQRADIFWKVLQKKDDS